MGHNRVTGPAAYSDGMPSTEKIEEEEEEEHFTTILFSPSITLSHNLLAKFLRVIVSIFSCVDNNLRELFRRKVAFRRRQANEQKSCFFLSI